MDIMQEMKRIGYRVVPDLVSHKSQFEIIIEPWDWDQNKKRSGRTKRTGFFFRPVECYSSSKKDTEFDKTMKSVQMTLINHFKNKKA